MSFSFILSLKIKLRALKTFLKIVLNKYFITFVFFIIWMSFFDMTNFGKRRQLNKELKKLALEKEYYDSAISANLELEKQLTSDSAMLEKYARERFFMKKDSEDVYLVIRE